MQASFLPLILMLFGGAGGFDELLDVADPRSYLEVQGIEYKVDALIEVLEAERTKDLSQIKVQETNKLQAMRALGALKDKSALPALKEAAESKLLFFDDYAAAAIASIEGSEPPAAKLVSDEDLKSDLGLLPEGVGMLVQMRVAGGGNVDIKKLIAAAAEEIPDAPDPDELLQNAYQQLAGVLGQVGNIRLDAITFGLSEVVGQDEGFVVLVLRGKYDHRAVESVFSEQKRTTHHEIGGTMFLGMDGDDAAIAPVSRTHLIFVAGAGWEEFPLEQVAANLKAKPAEPKLSDAVKKVVARADRSGSIWGAGVIPQVMRDEAPPLAPFEDLLLSAKTAEGEQLTMKLVGSGQDAKAVSESVEQMQTGLGEMIAQLEEQGGPGMDKLITILKSIKMSSKDGVATATAKLEGGASGLSAILVPFFSRF